MGHNILIVKSFIMFQVTNLLSSFPLHSVYHHKNIQHQLLPRSTIQILGRLMLVGMGSTRILTVTWWRKLSSRTNASHTPNKPAGHRIRKNASLPCTKTAPGSSRQTSNVFVSM